MKTFTIALLLSSGLMGCADGGWDAWTANRKGTEFLKAEQFNAAQEKFVEALSFDPLSPAIHGNLGLALSGQKRGDEALKSFEVAAQYAEDPALKFAMNFNRGALLGIAKKTDPAIAAYQDALDVNPESLEAKTNIELLVRSQQGQGQGEGEQKDQPQEGQQKDQKNDKGQSKDQDQKDQEKDDKGEQEKEKPQQREAGQKYKPREFKGEIHESEVKKILGEIRQQEQKIRSDYNRKDSKESPRDKDW